ncbi:MAG: hypothetical protein HYR60_25835 [Acidobacteria bacterium]|nr:hypothetical protein [Acidobacteriota bacterium]
MDSLCSLAFSALLLASPIRLPVNLATQAGQPYDARLAEQDLRRMWRTGRFEDIRVETDGNTVVFHAVEAPRLRLRRIHLEPSTPGLRLVLPEGTPLSRRRAHEIALEARNQLRARGFMDARVDYALEPASGDRADLRLTVAAGKPVRVKQVEFTGEPGLSPDQLRRALRSVRVRRVLPRLRLLPPYSPEAVYSDLARLRSLLVSKGYLDARVWLEAADVRGTDARIRFAVQSGRRYPVPPGDLCASLLAARREAERQGMLDFSASLAHTDLGAKIEHGPAYRVGRIDFTGHRHYKDTTIRRNFLLDEGQALDRRTLRKSLARLNRTRLFAPVQERDVAIHTHPDTGLADLRVPLTERKRGRWGISGPAGPLSPAGPLQASIGLLAFADPILLSWPALAVARPFSPGEGWRSGFALAPRMGWRASALSYAATQAQQRLLAWLGGDRLPEPELPVTVESPTGSGLMFCEPPQPRLGPLRNAAALGLQIFGYSSWGGI